MERRRIISRLAKVQLGEGRMMAGMRKEVLKNLLVGEVVSVGGAAEVGGKVDERGVMIKQLVKMPLQ